MKNSLREEIKLYLKQRKGSYALYFKDLSNNLQEEEHLFAINSQQQFSAASIIKIPIMVEAFRQSERGRLDLEEEISLIADLKTGGSGILKDLSSGLKIKLKDLVFLMMTVSDNTATNILIDRLSLENINQLISELGLKQTKLQRKMMDFKARQAGKDNYTSAADIGRLLELIWSGMEQISGPDSRQTMLDILKKQLFRDKLSFYLPEKRWKEVGSKTGSLEGIGHDASLFMLENSTYILVMLGSDFPDDAYGSLTLAEVSKMIFNQYL